MERDVLGGGGYLLKSFWRVEIFSGEFEKLRNFLGKEGVEKFWGGVEFFFLGGGLRKFWGRVEKFLEGGGYVVEKFPGV